MRATKLIAKRPITYRLHQGPIIVPRMKLMGFASLYPSYKLRREVAASSATR
jgi:hypothetical protein